ncbi:MAG TPA: DUF177 domain-containing protein, partial [Rubricoccaceae bacterium]
MLRVRIAPLSDGLHTETLAPTPAELELDPALFSDIAVEMQLSVATRQIAASFVVSATAHLVCDRTDEPFDQNVRGEHSVLIVAPDAPMASTDDEDVVVANDDASHADLTAPVRDTLMLALPLRRISPAAEALDLPTAFGAPAADDPADSRWAALSALRSG